MRILFRTIVLFVLSFLNTQLVAQAPQLSGSLLYHGYSGYNNWDSEMFILDFADSSIVNISSEWNIDHEMNGVFSPDGTKIVFMGDVRGGDRNWDIFLWEIGKNEPINLTSGSSAREEDPKFSPDGQKIVFKVDGNIKEMDLSGNIINTLTNTPNLEESMPYYSTDGNTIIFMEGAHEKADIYSMHIDGTNRSPLAAVPNVHEYYPITRDDTSFFYTAWVSESDYHDQLHLGFFNGSPSIKLPFNNSNADYSDATPAGSDHIILSSTRDGGNGGFDLYIANIYNGEIWSISDYNVNVNTSIEELGSSYYMGVIPVIDSSKVVTILSPALNTIHNVSEELSIKVKINNSNVSIKKVEFYLDDALIGYDTLEPFNLSFECTNLGLKSLMVKAYDKNGSFFQSDSIDVLFTQHFDQRTRIMLVGNSITQESPGYRGSLYDSLFYNGFRVDFVGSKHDEGMKDGDHCGYSDFVIGPDSHKWIENGNFQHVIKDEIRDNEPDIIALQVGIKDFSNLEDSSIYDPRIDGAIRLDALVDTIFGQDPNVTLLISNLLPLADGSEEINLFNSQIPEIVSKYSELGFNCDFVDMFNNCNFESNDWVDNVNPSQSGYTKIASVWYEKLKDVVTNKGLNAFFTYEKSTSDYLKLTLDARESQGKIDSYYWLINNEILKGAVVDFVFSDFGEYEIKLIITNDNQSDSIVSKISLGYKVPGKIEAEDYYEMSGVTIEPCSDSGGGMDVGGVFQGDWMSYSIDVEKTGYYFITYRIATPEDHGAIRALIDDSVMITTKVPSTGGWQNWESVKDTIFISKGMHLLKIIDPTNRAWNLNWIDFKYVGETIHSHVKKELCDDKDIVIYPNPSKDYFCFMSNNAENYHNVSIYTLKGDLVLFYKAHNNETIDIRRLKQGLYIVKINNSINKLVKIR